MTGSAGVLAWVNSWRTRLRTEWELVRLYRTVLYLVIGLSVLVSLLVFYIFAINFEDRLSGRSNRPPVNEEMDPAGQPAAPVYFDVEL